MSLMGQSRRYLYHSPKCETVQPLVQYLQQLLHNQLRMELPMFQKYQLVHQVEYFGEHLGWQLKFWCKVCQGQKLAVLLVGVMAVVMELLSAHCLQTIINETNGRPPHNPPLSRHSGFPLRLWLVARTVPSFWWSSLLAADRPHQRPDWILLYQYLLYRSVRTERSVRLMPLSVRPNLHLQWHISSRRLRQRSATAQPEGSKLEDKR
mmetsp:Transcript_27041/g.55363  ORF Transcript_27041/g.55363 Transcript_27041/m.55363 type:complete len:207 (-) Transcript_27041:135-755(-)